MKKKLLSWMLMFLVAFSSCFLPNATRVALASTDNRIKEIPPLLITEICPKVSRVKGIPGYNGSDDLYEYIEVYNATGKNILFSNKYKIKYLYDGDNGQILSKEKNLNIEPNIVIPAKRAVVFWDRGNPEGSLWKSTKNLTVRDFKNYYKSKLNISDTNYLVTTLTGQNGFSNSGVRGFKIVDSENHLISQASYIGSKYTMPSQIGTNKVVQYKASSKYSPYMEVYKVLSKPTPGTIEPCQEQAEKVSPGIRHIPPAFIDSSKGAELTATVVDAREIKKVSARYRLDVKLPWLSEGAKLDKDKYIVHIKSRDLWTSKLEYYFELDDGSRIVKSNVYTVPIEKSFGKEDTQTLPQILITEVNPEGGKIGDFDGYEFIEIFNNSDRPINMKNYSLRYRYPGQTAWSDLFWNPKESSRNITVGSGRTLVFWVINSGNRNKTVRDFNAHFGTSLVEGRNIVKIYCDGMSNLEGRTIVISTNSGRDISKASYHGEKDNKPNEIVEDKAIVYGYPVDQSISQRKLSFGRYKSTPGDIINGQVPDKRVHVMNDLEAPIINYYPEFTEADPSKDFNISLDVTDDIQLNTLKFFYKTNMDSGYTKQNIFNIDGSNQYNILVSSANLIGKRSYSYYFEASDGIHVSKSNVYTIALNSSDVDRSRIRVNIQDDMYINGRFQLKGTSSDKSPSSVEMKIDGRKVDVKGYSLERSAYFAVEVNNTNFEFKNAITMGNDVLKILDEPVRQYKTYLVCVPAERLKEGINKFYIRCGDKNSPFPSKDSRGLDNRDDFTMRNARLILGDGTVIYDSLYSDPMAEYKVGDSVNMSLQVGVNINIPGKYFNSAYSWIDTSKLIDGEHTLGITDGVNKKEVSFYVDNTPPEVTFNQKNKEKYKGKITIDPVIMDNLSGVDHEEVTLNGKGISIPYNTSSGKLGGGDYEVRVTATDKVGNKTMKTLVFHVDDETPNSAENISGDGKKYNGVDAKLTVKVSDPSRDRLHVRFYRGYKYTSLTSGFKGFKNAVEMEPPKGRSISGENAMTLDDYDAISSTDGRCLETDSDRLPYQRFEIPVDSSIDNEDRINVKWTGKSLKGRRVTLYAWNFSTGQWEVLDYKIADGNEFTLQKDITKKNHVSGDNKLQVMVQDKIQPIDRDFTFAWLSDTQYYSAKYPEIQESQANWILQNRSKMNIKYVIHTGDIVDNSNDPTQWSKANKVFKKFDDAKMNYGVLAGNHDVNHTDNDYTNFWKNYGENRFKDQETFGDSYKNNRGHYDLISADGVDFIVLYMGWNIGQDEYDWMNEMLSKYSDRKAILCFHEYLSVDGTRYAIGQGIYDNVVRKNKNVFLVLSGHYHGASRLVDHIDDDGDGVPDRTVFQVLADYQGYDKGGDGYLRLIQFNSSRNELSMKTYSPYLNDFNLFNNSEDNKDEYGYQDEFSLPVDLAPVNKQVATDSIEVNVYTRDLIKNIDNVESGANVSALWTDLEAHSNYMWYVEVSDDYDGITFSDIWSFTTGIGPSLNREKYG